MSYLVLERISKKFDSQLVLREIALNVNKGEFVSLLGPSGCGKTTTLRIIAGLENPTTGRVIIDNRVVNCVEENIFVEAKNRNLGMVFQSYALWPHMNVKTNLHYPLKMRGYSRSDADRKIASALRMVHMEQFVDRYPHQLSGGQQQRISIARALIADPDVLLMDEPLSNLDAKLREKLREEIVDLQRRTKITVVYVTHDYTEAMAISDRIAVMHEGVIQQFDTSEAIYERPANEIVANIVGNTNLINVEIIGKEGESLDIKMIDFDNAPVVQTTQPVSFPPESRYLQAVVRPEHISFSASDATLRGRLTKKTYCGERTDYWIDVGNSILKLRSAHKENISVGDHVGVTIQKMWLIRK